MTPTIDTALDARSTASPYINRELSWLAFNRRVLAQAADTEHPLLERVKFLAIVATNLDEFFMIRVAVLLRKLRAGRDDLSPGGRNALQQLALVRDEARTLLDEQERCWTDELRPRLAERGIRFVDPFPYISNQSTSLAVVVKHGGRTKFARIKLPPVLPRFVPVPGGDDEVRFAFLVDNFEIEEDDVIVRSSGRLGFGDWVAVAGVLVRKEADGIRRYAHVGTGNDDPATARVHGPVALHGVTDLALIRSLYAAASAGVEIDLLVRGICCLRPGVSGLSERIRVRSIVGRFLEHSRIFHFENGGTPEMFIGSADLMERNLDRRVEVVCPVLDARIREYLRGVVLDAYLRDSVRACELQEDGSYCPVGPAGDAAFSAQEFLLAYHTADDRVGDDVS